MNPDDLDIGDYVKVVRSFHEENDRGAAVLGGSFIDAYLAGYLKTQIVDDAPVDLLFSGFGPLTNFSQRRAIAFSFGLITDQEYSDLKYIGKIRNHFAHHPLDTAFDKPPVSDWCNELSTKSVVEKSNQGFSTRDMNRSIFIVSLSMSIANWTTKMVKNPNTEKQGN